MSVEKGPIGVFDSGIGGLTVLKEITLLLPSEDTVYLGDTARVPYGTKSRETVIRYSLEVAEFLMRFGIKVLVAACNTASAYALGELKKRFAVPIVGVVEPGAKAATTATRAKKIGVIGTEGTIKSGAYVNAIKRLDPRIKVFTRACPLFVPLAEEGWTDNDVARLAAKIYLAPFKEENIDALLLGCTHYPLLKKTIQDAVGNGVTLIDSGRSTAIEASAALKEKGLLKENRPKRRFFVTDSPDRFERIGKNFFGGGPLGAELVKLG
jgi:glutamate racemase